MLIDILLHCRALIVLVLTLGAEAFTTSLCTRSVATSAGLRHASLRGEMEMRWKCVQGVGQRAGVGAGSGREMSPTRLMAAAFVVLSTGEEAFSSGGLHGAHTHKQSVPPTETRRLTSGESRNAASDGGAVEQGRACRGRQR